MTPAARGHAGPAARLIRLLLCAAAGLGPQARAGDTVTLLALQDAAIFGSDGGVLGVDFSTHANGAGYSMFVGLNGSGSARRALLKFDLSVLPAHARVTEARLSLTLDRVPNSSAQRLVLHALTRAWSTGGSNSDLAGTPGQGAPAQPGDATWYYASWPGPTQPAGVRWTTPGGDFDAAELAATWVTGLASNAAPVTFSWSGNALAASVNTWLANPGRNHGWILVGNETQAQSVKRFITREAVDSTGAPLDAALRPHLDLRYDIVDSASTPVDGATPGLTSQPPGPFGQQRRRAALTRPTP